MSITPLLDFFRRGEVPRDVRLLAAQGALAPRAHEQLALLVLLHDDADPEVRATAERTLNRIPMDTLTAFLGRSDISIGMREFFADRGVFPSEMPAIVVDDPLVEAPDGELEETSSDESEETEETEEEPADNNDSVFQQIAKMGFTQRLKTAMKGSREMRAILIRDPNKMVAASVLSSPKVTEAEVESFAKMANVSEEVLRIIGSNRAWTKSYAIVVALSKNPKTPVALSLNLMSRLTDRDVAVLANDRNVPEPLRVAARRRAAQNRG